MYDVYVLENDDEAAETNVTKTRVTTKPDGVAIETMPNEEATETSATFAGGTDAALFFDFTDGLGDDVSDADSQDSNREDAPDADYPDTEDSFSEDEDEDAWGAGAPRRPERGGVRVLAGVRTRGRARRRRRRLRLRRRRGRRRARARVERHRDAQRDSLRPSVRRRRGRRD